MNTNNTKNTNNTTNTTNKEPTMKKTQNQINIESIITSKECPCCNELKPLKAFYTDKKRKDGLYANCKVCHRSQVARYAITEAGKASTKKALIKYKASNPEKVRSQARLKYNVRVGNIVRPDTCGVCEGHRVNVGKIEAHHASYEIEEALNVEWMCRGCHKKHHMALDKQAKLNQGK